MLLLFLNVKVMCEILVLVFILYCNVFFSVFFKFFLILKAFYLNLFLCANFCYSFWSLCIIFNKLLVYLFLTKYFGFILADYVQTFFILLREEIKRKKNIYNLYKKIIHFQKVQLINNACKKYIVSPFC